MKYLPGVLVFVAVFAFGLMSAYRSWNSMVYVYVGSSRMPAAVPKVFDFSNLRGGDLRMASTKRLLEDAKILKGEESVGVELGHFVTMGTSGRREFACQSYNKIEMVFFADGMAESGHVPEMTVNGGCVMGSDMNRIETLWIPNMVAAKQKTSMSEVSLDGPNPTAVKFSYVGSEWPTDWVLKTIRLYSSENPNYEMKFDQMEIRSMAPDRLRLAW